MENELLTELEQKIGYQFKDKGLLKHAMSHSSYANERHMGKLKSNERLEFLGDAVLELVTSEYLFHTYPTMPEGDATKMRASFTDSVYFWGRPSNVDYNGGGSGGSNKGTNNPEYLAQVEERIDAFLAAHPYLSREEVPAEMVTASGSGLDPDISIRGAEVQIRRVAGARGMSEAEVKKIVEENIHKPWLGLFGTYKVNVLKLNVALDAAQNK